MKKLTNLIIIDASGSMEGKKAEVKSGLKELLAQIKIDAEKDKGEVMTSTIVLDFSSHDDIRTIVNAGNSALLQDDVSENYSTRGSTALYDAIGQGFAMIPEGETKVFVSILTDGQENASREFDHSAVKALIEAKKKLGWVVTFMGTTEAAIKDAQSMGVSRGNTMSFANTDFGVQYSTNTMADARTMYYAASSQTLRSKKSLEKMSKEKGVTVDSLEDMDQLLTNASTDTDTKGVKDGSGVPVTTGGDSDSVKP